MPRLIQTIDLAFVDADEGLDSKFRSADSEQIRKDWHRWLGHTRISKTVRLDDGSTCGSTELAIACLLKDAVKFPNEIQLKDPQLLGYAQNLIDVDQELLTLSIAMHTAPDRRALAALQAQEQATEAKKQGILQEAIQAFERKHLSTSMLEAFWRRHFVPETQKKEHTYRYVAFLSQYGHQGGVLNACLTQVMDAAAAFAKEQGAEHYFRGVLSGFDITVSDTTLIIDTRNTFTEAQIFDKQREEFYQFKLAAGHKIELTSRVVLGVRANDLDMALGVLPDSWGFGDEVAEQIRRHCFVTCCKAEKFEGTQKGEPFVYYFPDIETGKTVLEKDHIFRALWLQLTQWIRHIFQKIFMIQNEKIQTAGAPECTPDEKIQTAGAPGCTPDEKTQTAGAPECTPDEKTQTAASSEPEDEDENERQPLLPSSFPM